LPPALLPRIFDLFVQGDASLDRTPGGLGIGLTLVHALVELHGGRVEARSAGLEQGSEFLVWLPVLPSGLPALAAAPEAAPAVAADGRLKILLVEDHQDTAESLAAMLEGWGHEVQVAFDGLAALRAVAALAPDVVLSDLGLPRLDGYEFARPLRQQPGLGAVPEVRVADPAFNAEAHLRLLEQVHREGAHYALCPELGLSGYSCADLFFQETLLAASLAALGRVAAATAEWNLIVSVGMPLVVDDLLFNCAVTLFRGRPVALAPKAFPPNYREFYQRRWFPPAADPRAREIT